VNGDDNGSYTTIDPSEPNFAQEINASGQIVGNHIVDGILQGGFLLDRAGYTTIDPPNSITDTACRINEKGQVVGYYTEASRQHGFVFEKGGYTTLDVPGSSFTAAWGINAQGQIVGTYAIYNELGIHGFLATTVAPPPTVTCSVVEPLLWPPNNKLANVGLGVIVTPPNAKLELQVYANDDADPSDAADIGLGTLQLRSERQGNGNGRVYLIVATASSSGTSFDVCTVVVPHDHSPRSIQAVQQQAAAAEASYRQSQTVPAGFILLGE
jgi:hypothetical protein